MCGIIGVVNSKEKVNKTKFKKLVDSMKHRGPDDWGIVHEEKFSFGFRRLSIIDLSKEANQPMTDWENKVVIAFNGEIYNYRNLREVLISKGHKFKTESDTEVILEAYKEWGISCISHLNGMFAIAIYDKVTKAFYLVRDRLGIKPLYYTNLNEKFIFCSELKGIINYPGFEKELNLKAVSCFLSFRYSMGRDTYFKGVHQLEPGYILKIQDDTQVMFKYWDINLNKKKLWLSKRYKRYLYALICHAVQIRTVSDVPLGSYLSGGIDSTAILCAMSYQTSKPIETFTVTFKEKGYDETYYSDLAAKYFKAKNTKLLVDGKDTLKHAKNLVKFKDQPIGMHNEVAVYLMAKELKKYVTVILSGEGADEIFSGYGRIFRSPFDYKRMKNKKGLTECDFFYEKYSYFPIEEKNEIYTEEMKAVADNDEHIKTMFRLKFIEARHRNFYDKISYVFETLHLPGLLLMMDSTAMAASVETRVPFVDHRLVQEMFNVPTRYKLRWKSIGHFLKALRKPADEISEVHDTTKFILKDLFKGEVPQEIIDREKMVFPVPLNDWFRNDFNKQMKKELLSKDSKIKMIFDQDKLKQWIEKKEKSDDTRFGRKMWLILNLEFWLREYF